MIISFIIPDIVKVVSHNIYFSLYGLNNILALSHNNGLQYFFYTFQGKVISNIYFNSVGRLIVCFNDLSFAMFDEYNLSYEYVGSVEPENVIDIVFNTRTLTFTNNNLYADAELVYSIDAGEVITELFVFDGNVILKSDSNTTRYSSNLYDWNILDYEIINVNEDLCVNKYYSNYYYIVKLKNLSLRFSNTYIKCGLNTSSSLMLDYCYNYEFEESKHYYYTLFENDIVAISNDGIYWFLNKTPVGTKYLVLNKNNFSKDILYLANTIYRNFIQYNDKMYCIFNDTVIYNYTDDVSIIDVGQYISCMGFNLNNGFIYMSYDSNLHFYDWSTITMFNECGINYTKLLCTGDFIYLLSSSGDLDRIDINANQSIYAYLVGKNLINFEISTDGLIFSYSVNQCFDKQEEVSMIHLANFIKFASYEKNFVIVGEDLNFAITNFKNGLNF